MRLLKTIEMPPNTETVDNRSLLVSKALKELKDICGVIVVYDLFKSPVSIGNLNFLLGECDCCIGEGLRSDTITKLEGWVLE